MKKTPDHLLRRPSTPGDRGYPDAFREEAFELLTNLESLLLDLERSPQDPDLIGQVFRTMHTIKGSGSMFGFNEVVAVVHEIETVFDLVREGRLAVTGELIECTLQARDQILLMIDPVRGGEPPSTVPVDRLIADFRAMADQASLHPSSRGRGQACNDEPASGGVRSGNSPLDGSIAPASVSAFWRIRFVFALDILKTGTNPLGILRELASLGDYRVRGDALAVPPPENLAPASFPLTWDLLLHTKADLNAIRDVFLFVQDRAEIEIAPATLADIDAFAEPKGARLPVSSVPDPMEAGTAFASGPRAFSPDVGFDATSVPLFLDPVSGEARRHDLRMSAGKIDRLVDMIGELATIQARLGQAAGRRNDAELVALAEELGRLSSGLRDGALRIRMLPIGSCFEPLQERIREIARHLGKDLRLEIRGTDTELDKDILDRLGDPLWQVMQIAVMHSIEPPEVRTARGKPRSATLSVAARHCGGSFCIDVRDDGHGFDSSFLRTRAQDIGKTVSEGDLADRHLLRLLCHPGFFAGTDLEAAMVAIDGVRGTLDVENRPSQGLTFSLRVPLTLAVFEGLAVALGSWHFVLPLAAVEECIELTRQEEDLACRKNVVMVRNQIVPYISLREKFAVEGQPPAIQQIAIAGVGQHRVGFLVDRVIGGFQTVIKPLGSLYRNTKGISGAAILGDETIALIIDLPAIIQEETHLFDRSQGSDVP